MKNYKLLVLIGLLFLSAYACYSRIDSGMKLQQEYDGYLNQARKYREGKIYYDALNNYKSALEMQHSMTLCEEIGEMILEQNEPSAIESWGEYVIEQYPHRPEGYIYLIDYYLEHENYKKCFTYNEIVTKRGIESEEITSKMNKILYQYELKSLDYDEVKEYTEGYAVVGKEGIYNFITKTGKKISKDNFSYTGPFNADYAAVQDKQGEFFFIDKEGNRRINYPNDEQIEVTKLGYIGNGIYPFGNDEVIYYSDLDGNIVLGPYQDGTSFTYEIAAVKENDKWHMINKQGETLSDNYEGFCIDPKGAIFRNGVAFAYTSDGVILLNESGEKISDALFQDAKCFLDTTYAAVKQNNLWGFIDASGKIIIEPRYQDAKSFLNEMAAVKIDDLWGYINMDADMLIVPAFEDANCMQSNGCATVKELKNAHWSLLKMIYKNYQSTY